MTKVCGHLGKLVGGVILVRILVINIGIVDDFPVFIRTVDFRADVHYVICDDDDYRSLLHYSDGKAINFINVICHEIINAVLSVGTSFISLNGG